MIEEAVYDRLISEVGIDAYPLVLPASVTLPAMTYQRISTVFDYTHDGDALLDRVRFQFDIWAETFAEARQLAGTLRAAWSGYVGQVYENPEIHVSGAFISGERDLREDEPPRYRVSMDVMMWVRTVE